MIFRFSKRAARNVEEIYAFISKDKPDAAAGVVRDLLDSFERLTAFPKLGHVGRRKGTREFVKPPYVIVDQTSKDAVTIYAVLHSSQKL